MTHKFEILRARIIEASLANNWYDCREEWYPYLLGEDPTVSSICLCTQEGLRELHYIKNRHTHGVLMVGSVCINRFLEVDMSLVWQAIRRVRQDIDNALNEDAIRYFHSIGAMNDYERAMYMRYRRKHTSHPMRRRINTTCLKRILSKPLEFREDITIIHQSKVEENETTNS